MAPAGRQNVSGLIKRIFEETDLPDLAKDLFRLQAKEYSLVEARLSQVDSKLMAWHRQDDSADASPRSRCRADRLDHAEHESAARRRLNSDDILQPGSA